MTDIMKDILDRMQANQDVYYAAYYAAYNEGFRAGVASCAQIIEGLCGLLDQLTPTAGEHRDAANEMIADAKALIDRGTS